MIEVDFWYAAMHGYPWWASAQQSIKPQWWQHDSTGMQQPLLPAAVGIVSAECQRLEAIRAGHPANDFNASGEPWIHVRQYASQATVCPPLHILSIVVNRLFLWGVVSTPPQACPMHCFGIFSSSCAHLFGAIWEVLRHQQFLKPWALNLWHQMRRKQQYKYI